MFVANRIAPFLETTQGNDLAPPWPGHEITLSDFKIISTLYTCLTFHIWLLTQLLLFIILRLFFRVETPGREPPPKATIFNHIKKHAL